MEEVCIMNDNDSDDSDNDAVGDNIVDDYRHEGY